MPHYNKYHTNLVLLHQLNALPNNYKKQIPASTLRNWNNRNTAAILGLDTAQEKDIDLLRQIITCRKLLQAAKALYLIFISWARIFISVPD